MTTVPAAPVAPAARRRRQAPDWLRAQVLMLPTLVWLGVLLLVPLGIGVGYSLGTRGVIDPVRFPDGSLRWSNYRDALDPGFLPIFVRSLVYAGLTTVLCLLLGFPLAYWIARHGGRYRSVLLVLVILPFWTSYLIRMYAWRVILSDGGVASDLLAALHLGGDRSYLNTDFAVVIGLTYGFLPFMVLPLYASIERMNPTLVEAAYDLGAGRLSTLLRVTVPAVAPGIVAGTLLTFVPAVGDFVTPTLLGGVRTQMFGNVVADQFRSGQNWPLGSAMAVLLMSMILVAIFLYLRRVGEDAL